VTSPARNIVALGGGGFSMTPRNHRLDDYILSLTGKRRPRVLFLPTASGDSTEYRARFQRAFRGRARPSELCLFRLEHERRKPAQMILDSDVVYVGGGNTANMLAVWRLHGVDRALRAAWKRGVVLCGVSAGAVCWFENGLTDSFGRPLKPLDDGLAFLRGSMCPHFDGERDRRPRFLAFLGAERLPSGWAADDDAALHFRGRALHAVVAARRDARGWRLERQRGKVLVRELPVQVLSAR